MYYHERPRVVRPCLALDCDGVLSNFIEPTLLSLARETGKQYAHDDVKVLDIVEGLHPGDPELKKRVYAPLKAVGGCLSIPAYSEAKVGFKALSEIADIIIVTSPFSDAPTWMHEREAWLTREFGIPKKKVIHAHEKQHIVADFFVDDVPAHIEAWSKEHVTPGGRQALLWDKVYNRDASPLLTRVRSWDELISIVGRWNKENY